MRSPTIRSSVDLPQPEGPIRDTNSPGWTSRSIAWRALVSPPVDVNTLSTPRNRTAAIVTPELRRYGTRSGDRDMSHPGSTSGLHRLPTAEHNHLRDPDHHEEQDAHD